MNHVTKDKAQLVSSLLLLLGSICIGASIGSFIATKLVLATCYQGYTDKTYLLTAHAGTALGGIIVGPLVYWYQIEKKTIQYFFLKNERLTRILTLTMIVTLAAMVINTVVNQWNMELHLPPFLHTVETWAKRQQIELKTQLDLLTTFHSTQDLLATILVVGMLTAVGEELVCRGILQNLLYQATGKLSRSVLLSSIIFSAIHLDLYSFFPRLLMGLFLGYLYGWTNNLWVPIFSHFLNNSLILLLSFLTQRNIITNLSVLDQPSSLAVMGCCTVATVAIFYLKRQTKVTNTIPN